MEKRKHLGPYFVPLHIPPSGIVRFEDQILSEAEVLSLRLQHWRSMLARNPMGFRRPPNIMRKRKKPRNPRTGELDMILNGLALVARHGNREAKHVVEQAV